MAFNLTRLAERYSSVTDSAIHTTSYGSRVASSAKGVFGGLLIMLLAGSILWFNESRHIDHVQAMTEGRKVAVALDSPELNSENEGKLVYFQGNVEVEGVVTDPEFGISSTGLSLTRKVQMFQWEEHEEKKTTENSDGSKTTTTKYSYSKTWSNKLINSSSFNSSSSHQNPNKEFPFEELTVYSKTGRVGDFQLSQEVISKLPNDSSVSVESFDTKTLANSYKTAKTIYIREIENQDSIGDLRIEFAASQPEVVSLVGKQQSGAVVPYKAKSGASILIVENKEVPLAELFAAQEEKNKKLTWAFRGLGTLLMIVGVKSAFGLFATIFAFLPFARRALNNFMSVAAAIIGWVLANIIIGVAWLFYRPIIAVAIVLGAIALGWLIKLLFFKKPKESVG